jgi:sigma-B regulation protein RsbU (phosphoserine phosphatase)
MGKFRKFLHRSFHIIKSFIIKLSPFRRVIFIFALFFLLTGNGDNSNTKHIISAYMFLFLLFLELKDKLLVRRELEAGRAVQDALIPQIVPELIGWDVWFFTQPANDVGGDLVDYLKINETRYMFVLSDVSGKGLGAALLTSKLQATLRAIISPDKNPSEIGKQLNSIFNRDAMKTSFATLIYVEIDTALNQLSYFNAGHLQPLIISVNDIRVTEKGGPAVGLIKNAVYHENIVSLNKNEIFFVYSDGLTEARNEDGSFFGEVNLFDLIKKYNHLSSSELGKNISRVINDFRGQADRTDDLSLLIIKKK